MPEERKVERKVIICVNQAEFDALNRHVHEALQRDVPRYNAKRWAQPIKNAKDEQQIAFPVKERIEKYLSGAEKNRKITLPEEWLSEINLAPK